MASPTILISANLAWNLVNFRSNLIRELVARNVRVVALAPDDPAMAEKLAAMGCTVEPVPIDSKGLNPLRDLGTFARYLAVMRRVRPDAYLGWTIKPNIYGGLAARLLGMPAICNISGLGTAFIRRNLLTRLVALLYRTGLGGAQTIFFQNDDDRDLFLAMGLVRTDQARRIAGSGIDTALYAGDAGSRPARGHFLMVARLLGDKGVREYVDAARILKRRHEGLRFSLLGFLDVANRTAIARSEVDAWLAEGVIEYHPPVDDVRPAMRDADCVVLPSYREGTSRVLLEGAAMARPLVASDVPGCREVIDDGVSGFLCAAQDAESLAEAMERVWLLDDTGWQAMARAGRAKVEREFSDAVVVGRYLEALADAGIDLRHAASSAFGFD